MDIGTKEGISWIGSGIFFLWAFSLSGTTFLGGLIALSVGILLIPQVREYLQEEYEIRPTRTHIVIILVISIFLISSISGGGGSASYSNTVNSGGVSEQQYQNLQSEYQQLRNDHQQLQERYSELQSNSVSQERYQNLQKKLRYSVSPPYVIAENRSFRMSFLTLSGEPVQYVADAETLEAQIQTGMYMRRLSVSEMEYLNLDSMASDFEGGTKYQRLGEHGRYYQMEPFIVESNFKVISPDIYERYDTDQKRVREVWYFVTQMNTYSTEIEETPRMPLETLLMGGGDCEDTAILAASMLEAMPADWDVKLVFMDADRPQDPQNVDHVLVYVDTGEYQTFMETTSNAQMSPYQEVNGFYVDV